MGSRDSTKTDFSSFMCVILMLTGCLVTIMISNIVIIAANPENVQITSIVPTEMDDAKPIEDIHGNKVKNPWYVEVLRDRLVIYPGEIIVNLKDLEEKDNNFERLLSKVSEKKDRQYIVLLVRPYASSIARQLKKIIVDREIDIGIDLLEGTNPVKLVNTSTNAADKLATKP